MPLNNHSIDAVSKLPEELKAVYKTSRKSSPTVESLKVAAALKLWNDRGHRDIQFEAPITFDGKTVSVTILTKNADGLTIAVECASTVKLRQLSKRIATLQRYLPPDSYIIAVFPETVEKQAEKITELADEVWITGNNGTVEQMMFTSTFHTKDDAQHPSKQHPTKTS
jgi:hypothetical protein